MCRLDLTEAGVRVLTRDTLHTAAINALALSADGKALASAGSDGRLIFWDPATLEKRGEEWRVPEGLTCPGVPTALAFAPDGRTLAVGFASGVLYVLRTP